MKLSDEELIAAIESEESQALDLYSGELQKNRAEAWARYNGDLLGNEVEGRSQITDKGVMDTIQWIMPSLVRIYLGGDDVGKFEPIGPEDEYAAQCETEVCNWYLTAKNDFYSHIVATLTDALLLKNGYMVAFWTERDDVMTETYQGLADEEVAMLMGDKEVNVVEHTEYPDPLAPMADEMGQPLPTAMLHDVKVELKRKEEYVAVESIPTDEMLVSRRQRWTSLADADFVEWRRRVTIGQLRAEGFDIPDDVPGYQEFSSSQTARDRFGDRMTEDDSTPDMSRRVVMFKDAYIRIDLRGKGTPQLWRVAFVDGMREPVLKEEADFIPFSAFSPIIYPHSHVGTSVFDLINDLCLIKTVMERQLIDGVFIQNTGRMAIDVNKVNVDDMLVSRPGGLVRVDGAPGEAMFPIPSNDAGGTIMGALEYIDGLKEGRTGVTRYSAGLDANTLNKTATGVQAIQSAANQRIELIARTLAGGFRDLFLSIHALACKHSTKPIQIKLKGGWQAIDPRSWRKRTDFTISVGMGTGSPETQMAKLQMIAQFMQQGVGMGLCGPDEFYNWGVEFMKSAGYRNPSKFIIEPEKDPQTGKAKTPPPKEDPIVQAEKVKGEVAMKKHTTPDATEIEKAKIAAESNERIEKGKNALDGAKIGLQAQQQTHDQQMDKVDTVAEIVASLRDAIQALNAPKEIVRDKAGRASGVRVVR